jgi:inosine-uridine nucleoside N-ribohydrolase
MRRIGQVTSIIVDCDPGHDDAIALLLALASEEVRLLGVTTVAGNQTLARTTANAIRILDHVGRGDVPVAAGASRPLVREPRVSADVHGPSGIDGADLPAPSRGPEPAHAIDWIASTLSSSPAPVTLVAVGPLTNVAMFLARYPELEALLERIVLMGGAIGEGNVTPAAEFNIWADPEAAHRVFSSGVDLTMVGLDVTHKALIDSAHVESLASAGKAGRLVADLSRFSLAVHADRYGWKGTPVHDAVALAHVIDGSLLETAHRGVRVDTGGELSRGRTNVDLWHAMGWKPSCHVATDIDAARFVDLLVGRIEALP